ncbi:hypothetical protein GC167_01240 [bacterium]|nr:hypothetical protein [bacterium]
MNTIIPYFFKKRRILYSVLWAWLISGGEIAGQSDTVRYYHENGRLSAKGLLKDGQPDGYWKSYHLNGQLKTEGNRVGMELDGPWRFYDEEGNLTVQIEYERGKKQGNRSTYTKGILIRSEPFVLDQKQGIMTEYDSTGTLIREVPFVEDREQGLGYEWSGGLIQTLLTFKSGVLVRKQPINRTDRLGRKQGTWMEFRADRSIAIEGTYQNDLKHGFWKYYRANGNLIRTERWENGVLMEDVPETAKVEIRREIDPNTGKLKSVGSYLDGKPNGIHRLYNAQGEPQQSMVYLKGQLIEEGGIVDEQGRRQGHWKRYYPSMAVMHEGDYVDDLRTGVWKYYFENGALEQTGTYRMDQPENEWVWYYPSGSIWREEEYVGGLEDGPSVEYAEDGTVITQGEYIEGLKEGPWVLMYGDQREEGSYFEGERQGEWKHWYRDLDRLNFKGSFLNGQPDGVHEYYHSNGTLQRRERWSNGIKRGIWEYFNSDGMRYLTVEYDNSGREIRYNGVKLKYGRRIDRESVDRETTDNSL